MLVVIVAIAAFLAPLTSDKPPGDAAFSAALIALCTAGWLIASPHKTRWIPGLGGLATAYLWLADASDMHPFNIQLPGALLLALSGFAVVTVFILLVTSKNN